MGEISETNIGTLVTIQTIFCVIFLYKINKVKSIAPPAIFERSFSLLIIANLANYFETLLNLMQGLLYIENQETVSYIQILILLSLIYISRFYSACMCLRILRVYFLYLYRRSKLKKSTLTKISSVLYTIIITNTYSLIVSALILTTVLLLDLDPRYISYLNNFFFGIESVFFIALSNIEYKINSHPTLYVEYFLYSIVWTSGCFSSLNYLTIRWLYQAPIRNNLLLVISWISIKSHIETVRPPLPLELQIIHVFQIAELYEDFKKFIKTEGEEWKSSYDLMEQLVKGKFYNRYENADLIVGDREIDNEIRSLINDSRYSIAIERTSDSLSDIFQRYICSSQFLNFKKYYAVVFN